MHLLLFSKDEDDISFYKSLAGKADLVFVHKPSVKEVGSVPSRSTIFIYSQDMLSDLPNKEILALRAQIPLSRQILTTKSDSLVKDINDKFDFGHLINHKSDDRALSFLSCLVRAVLAPEPFGLSNLLPPGSEVAQLARLSTNAQRPKAVDGLRKMIESRSLPAQTTMSFVSAIDELIVNAIYNAPYKDREHYRKNLDRKKIITFEEQELVGLSFGVTKTGIYLSVSDQFGSFEPTVIKKYISVDYSVTEYKTFESQRGGGIGLNGIIASGINLVVLYRPGFKSETTIFVPIVQNNRGFLSAFKYFGFTAI